MYQALYRKWRPRRFEDVVGQQHITGTLKKQVETGRLSHAYLFVGTRGTGKTTCAKILARAVNCEHPINGDPCNECPSCRGIESGGIMDVVELDAASNNSVDNVRALRDEAIFSPANVKKRVYIIDEVHMLSGSAFNALLKILEEPPEHLMFILCTTELRKVLPTIVSRCQRHSFKRLSPSDIAGRLRYVAGQENMRLDDDAAELLARLADGGMRDGLSLLDQCSAADHIDTAAVLSAMGLAGSQKTADLLDALCARDTETALTIFDELWKAGKDPANILDELGGLLRDVLLTQAAPRGSESLISGAFGRRTLERFAKNISGPELLNALTQIENAATAGANPRRAAEMCLVSLCSPEAGESLAALRARVARLERSIAAGIPVGTPAPVPAPTPAPATQPEPEPKAAEPADDAPFYTDEDAPPPPEEEPVFLPPEPTAPAPRKAAAAPPAAKAEPQPPAVPAAPAPAVSDDGLWDTLVQRLQGQLEMYIHCQLLPSAQTVGILSGDTLTIHVASPFTLMQLDESSVRIKIQQEASALAGRPVTVKVTDAPAAPVKPDLDRLDSLSKFANFKFE